MPSLTLSDAEMVDAIRVALAEIEEVSISDDTIEQAFKRFSKPYIDSKVSDGVDDELYTSAVIALGAEQSFNAWLTLERMRDAEIETFTRPSVYREKLKSRTAQALALINVVRPRNRPINIQTMGNEREWEGGDRSR